MKYRLTFTEPLLGSWSGNKEIMETHVLSRAPEGIKPDEADSVFEPEAEVEKMSTFFPRNETGEPILYDYMIRGFLKEACGAMIAMETLTQEELKRYGLTKYMHRRTIDRLIFVKPRKILLHYEGKITFVERSLRAITMHGERICLARSEQIPAGAWVEIETIVLNPKLEPFIEQWLKYGELQGLGQWRNGSYGRFETAKVE